MTDPLVCTGLTMTFADGRQRRTVLDGLDLTVAAGEIVVITGDSGSGKSTLLTLAGLLRKPEAGEVRLVGTATSELSERHRTTMRRDHIAFVYQSANLLPSLTALEQLQLVGHIRGRRPSATEDRAARLLHDLGIGERADQLPAELSGGERQRVGIARALMSSPDVLIADEPTASLDPTRAASVAEVLVDVARRNDIGAVIVAHDQAPQRHADRLLHLENGSLHPVTAAGS